MTAQLETTINHLAQTLPPEMGSILYVIKNQKDTMELLSSIKDVFVQTWALTTIVMQMRTTQMFTEHIERLSSRITVLEARTSFLSPNGVEE